MPRPRNVISSRSICIAAPTSASRCSVDCFTVVALWLHISTIRASPILHCMPLDLASLHDPSYSNINACLSIHVLTLRLLSPRELRVGSLHMLSRYAVLCGTERVHIHRWTLPQRVGAQEWRCWHQTRPRGSLHRPGHHQVRHKPIKQYGTCNSTQFITHFSCI